MKRTIQFTKMVASGNDFCVIDNVSGVFGTARLARLARMMCDRKFGCGADGLLVRERSGSAVARMRIFNADGSEAEMCGNGARCFSLYLAQHAKGGAKDFSFMTKAGLIKARVAELIRVRMTDPGSAVFNAPVAVGGRAIKINSINTGVPHAVIFVEGLDTIDVDALGRAIRYHRRYAPAGTNVNFCEVTGPDSIAIRTYERGVEGETLACGTGSCASALISNAAYGIGGSKVRVKTAGGEELNVYFTRKQGGYGELWLEGKANIVYEGRFFYV